MAESEKIQLNNWQFHYGEIKLWDNINLKTSYEVAKADKLQSL